MRNLDSNELQHVYGGGKACTPKKNCSNGKGNSNCHKTKDKCGTKDKGKKDCRPT